jgi:methionine synthase II (cobalamin-independent)
VTLATGIGSMPGDKPPDFAEAMKCVVDTIPGLPHLPELPGRGVTANLTGRALAVVTGLGIDLQPAGWRLTQSSGVDYRRARSLLAQDLDTAEDWLQGYRGAFKQQIAGPWTLAATVEKPRGDKVLSDHGARRELAQALAEGLRGHLVDVRRRLPGVTDFLVQLDEPSLPAVLAGQIPTASGFGRHRTVQQPEAAETLSWVTAAITEAEAIPVVHCCDLDFPIRLVRSAGVRGISVDVGMLDVQGYDDVAQTLEDGDWVFLGLIPPHQSAANETSVTDQALRFLDMLGLEPADKLVITPACGLASATHVESRQALTLAAAVAKNLSSG